MKHTRIVSLVLAALLQLAPLTRTLITMLTPESPNLAIVFRWAVGAAAMLGGYDAVSGASTVITSPSTATGTNGVPFSFRLTTGPQVASSYTASPLPPGLTLNTTSGKITGTPTQVGVTVATVQGCDGGNGCTPPATLTITIVAGGTTATAPSITTQPASQTVTAGANVSFSVVASGTAPLSYQWRLNGANIAGATSATYALTNVQSGNAGTYSVVVSNSAGSITSANATLTVNPAPVAPSITTQPASQTVTAGANVSFSVVASGTAPLSYQWRFNGANVAGATSATYALTNVQSGNAGTYSVVISNSAGNVTSANATLTVNPAVIAPTITTQPTSQSVVVGSSASFTVVATGTAPLSYQWRLNGANLAGATSATLNLSNVQAANAGTYSVVVANTAGSVTSANATLTVTPAAVAPSITTQPASQTVTAGANVSFTVVATGSAPMSYQWQFNGANIAGATGATYALTNVQAGNAGAYSVIVSNSVGSVTSADASLTVNPAPIAPAITTQPVSQAVTAGNSVSFSVVATGTAPLSYQWRFNGSNIAGATSATLALSNVQAGNAGNYSVIVANAAGSVTSANATLTVNAAPSAPSITSQPASRTVNVGAAVTFSVTATGTAPMTYQWRYNGADLSGATSASLALLNVQTNQAGSYSVVVANALGSVTSADAVLTVQVAPVDLRGTYSGLFYPSGGATLDSSGFVTVRVVSAGKFKGKLTMNNLRSSFVGQFDAKGDATATASTRDGQTISITLHLDPTSAPQLTGTVNNGTWTADIVADAAPVNPVPSPLAGNYQMSLSQPGGGGGTPDDGERESSATDESSGLSGSATIIVDSRARLRMTGRLNNGKKLKQSVSLSTQGDWPVWTSLGSEGALLGWLGIRGPTAPVQGSEVLWLHPDGTVTPLVVGSQ